MSDQMVTGAKETTADNSSAAAVNLQTLRPPAKYKPRAGSKGGLAMAVCCAAPLLLVAAVVFLEYRWVRWQAGF